jgi:hypothetical protein
MASLSSLSMIEVLISSGRSQTRPFSIRVDRHQPMIKKPGAASSAPAGDPFRLDPASANC